MNKNVAVVGVDIAKDFSYYCILAPNGQVYIKSFKVDNTMEGLLTISKKIKEVEKAFDCPSAIVLESTGHYSNRLVHFFHSKDFNVYLINPLLSHSIKNSRVRKVKTDKVDAEELAKLFFLMDLRKFEKQSDYFENAKILSRTHYQKSEEKVKVISQLRATLEQVMPGFKKIFSNLSSKTSIKVLLNYPSPKAILEANRDEVVDLIKKCSRKSRSYALDKYKALIKCAEESLVIGIQLEAYYECIKFHVDHLSHLIDILDSIDKKMKQLARNIPEIELLKSIPGIGDKTACTIIGEIGSINRFNNAKQLVAFCGVDPSVKQSGNFTGSKNKITKRGSTYIRKALYLVSVSAIRKKSNGKFNNKVIYDYYQKKIQSKAKKQALGAIMNKIVRIIFSVLKNRRPFVLITPEEQVRLYKSNLRIAA